MEETNGKGILRETKAEMKDIVKRTLNNQKIKAGPTSGFSGLVNAAAENC